MSVEIRIATKIDLEVIHQLASSIWRKHYPGIKQPWCNHLQYRWHTKIY